MARSGALLTEAQWGKIAPLLREPSKHLTCPLFPRNGSYDIRTARLHGCDL